MRRRLLLVVPAAMFTLVGIACVDLFHSTDFATLCTTDPNAAACGNEGGADGSITDTGTDAPPPPIDFCAWSTDRAREEATRACALMGACSGPLGPAGESPFGNCVVRAMLAYDCAANPTLRPRGAADALFQCLARAKTCTALTQCLYRGPTPPCPDFTSGKFTSCSTSTERSVRIECSANLGDGGSTGVEPCLLSGRTCQAMSGGALSACGGVFEAGTCETVSCVGTNAVDCKLGATNEDVGVDCALMGAGSCSFDQDAGAPACAPGEAARTCTGDATPTCKSDVVTSCIDGKQALVDCRKLGLECDVSTTTVPLYEPSAACVKAGGCTGGDTCEGTKLRGCGRGATFEADCTAIGLGACTTNEAGRAACGPPP